MILAAVAAATIGVNAASWHISAEDRTQVIRPAHRSIWHQPIRVTTRERLRTFTPGVYFRAPSGFTAGVMQNSFADVSAYAGWTWETPGRLFAMTAGGISGYRGAVVRPLVLPSLRLSPCYHCAALRVGYIPRTPNTGRAHVIHFAIEKDL